ncbi:inorganic phosphate transporter [Alistipes sp. OttesenSCG-928-B03]|nr:inorganic phosphate transporter [Alistipes sp. OttesenSCG-928-B03]
MDGIYILIVGILMALAVMGLVVGVANDAVNFLNSAIGSKAAPRTVILIVASVGIMIGALTSSGMMEVARSGVFNPAAFTFNELMMLFLGVMFANVILLDLFNTFGLPTSTTVSLVFGLLGSGVAAAAYKIIKDEGLKAADISQFINSGSTLVIVSGILISVVLAFVAGSVVMYVTRVIFTFRYKKVFRNFGYLWCGVAFTAIVYFALFKGLKSTGLITPEFLELMSNHLWLSLTLIWIGCSALLALLQHILKVNILKITILAGTFSLALAFAGNDLVNFIGVPIAGYDAYHIAAAAGDPNMTMGALAEPVQANFFLLMAAGIIMVFTLCTSKKARTVSDTEINLAKQDDDVQRFGSTMLSRSLVRAAVSMNKGFEKVLPNSFMRSINKRFLPLRPSEEEEKNKAPFDMIRATVNLTVASILISMATSLKLPLSTTYVTFMVSMGSSLADRAWGRESAVYRITGVLTVISGWFVTALIAFLLAFVVTLVLMYGGLVAIIAITLLCVYMIIHSNMMHKKREQKSETVRHRATTNEEADQVVNNCITEVISTMEKATEIYKNTIIGIFNEDRKMLRQTLKDSNELFYLARERKYEVMPTLQKLQDNYIENGHYYVQAVDYMSEMTKALVHITRPSFEHIDNNHEGLSKEQMEDLMKINDEVSTIYDRINAMLRDNDYHDIDNVMRMRDRLFEMIDVAIKEQLRRIKTKATSTKSSMLYLNILNETKTMVLQSRNLLKSQKHFIEKN